MTIITTKTKTSAPISPIHNLHLTIDKARVAHISKITTVQESQITINNRSMIATITRIRVMTGIIEVATNMIIEAVVNMTTKVQVANSKTL